MTNLSAEAALEHLDDEQRAVATALTGPVVVLAGAGTGKTRAITHRIAYGVKAGEHEAERSLAVTFTVRAAGEMRARLRTLGVGEVAVRTFHSAALRQLRYFWPSLSDRTFPDLISSKLRLITDAASSCGVPVNVPVLRDLSADIEWAKNCELTSAEILDDPHATRRVWSMEVRDVARVYAAYEELKRARGQLDFDDVLLVTVGALQSRPDMADKVRKAFRWFTVDEFQDVNPLQHRLLDLWRGDRDDICVVGDVSQTIYSFTGATPTYLTEFARKFRGATEVRLVNCYRCSGPIVELANAVAAQAPKVATLMLRAVTPAGQEPAVEVFADDVDEAEQVATRVRRYLDAGVAARDMTVLFRINAQSAELEAAFSARGIPVVMRGTERFFDRPEIREAITRLRGAARAGEANGSIGDEIRGVLSAAGWSEAQPKGGGAVRERWESLAALVALADDLAEMTIAEFIAELDQRSDSQHAPTADGVTLSSLHSAKGLERDIVFIIGCSERLLPYIQGSSDEPFDVDEERRLFYVGITRARRNLHLSWARSREPGGRQSRQASRFLEAADPGSVSEPLSPMVTRGTRPAMVEPRRKGPAKCRICGKGLVTAEERTPVLCRSCPENIDGEQLEALQRWRTGEAKAQDVPEFMILTDTTLRAIVGLAPSTMAELGEITGVGPAKVESYGGALLGILAVTRPDVT